MAKIDESYNELLLNILNYGYRYEDPNRKGIFRKQVSHHVINHNFEDGFPLLTTKKISYNLFIKELLVFLSGDNTIKGLHDENIHFWDKDFANYNKSTTDLGKIYPYQMRRFNGNYDQIEELINTLRENKYATKKIVTMWNPAEKNEMALTPCHWSFEALVDANNNGLTIKFNMGSSDVFLGLPANIVYYSTLCYILAKMCNLNPIGIIADLTNVHIYEPHYTQVFEQLSRTPIECSPTFSMPKNAYYTGSIDSFLRSVDTHPFKVFNYQSHPVIKAEMLAYSK